MKRLFVVVLLFGMSFAKATIESSIYPTVENRPKVIHMAAKFGEFFPTFNYN